VTVVALLDAPPFPAVPADRLARVLRFRSRALVRRVAERAENARAAASSVSCMLWWSMPIRPPMPERSFLLDPVTRWDFVRPYVTGGAGDTR